MTTPEPHSIGINSDCKIIPNAQDKAICLSMNHFHARSFIVNTKTGDVLSQLFVDSYQRSAQSLFNTSTTCKLQHSIFFEQEGDKVAYILTTNYIAPVVSEYINYLKPNHVSAIHEVVADIKEYSGYEEFQFGEIPVYFDFDLKNLSTVQIRYSDDGIENQPLKDHPIVTDTKSTLPDIKAVVGEFRKYESIGQLIAMADDRLPGKLKELGIELSKLSLLKGYNKNVITDTLKKALPFSDFSLYKENNIDKILKTLNFLKDIEADRNLLFLLCEEANKATSVYINHSSLKETDMDYLVEHTKKIITFSKNIKDSTPDSQAKREASLSLLCNIERMLRTLRSELHSFDRTELYAEVCKLMTTSNEEFSS